jgi:hypothetical protein
MPDLHTRLLAELDDLDMRIGGTGPLIPAIRGVLDLHRPVDPPELVLECDHDLEDYPCATVKAVAEALGVEATDG